ncbi:hypothetical protein [Natrialba sp. SSL1]|uniref:hypothetical protein n=1 Tax=Natrialba sp. SSL1 TaxID=1869245 RepID=UPI0008F8C1E8|nr:hypothetical protein [Natrialba sp. SSL1]OIB58177.1 hypothetical protein BBD46_09870 [Natrialba sp. SSL1]
MSDSDISQKTLSGTDLDHVDATRRDLLQGAGALGTAAVVGSSTTGTVAADDDDDDDDDVDTETLVYDVASPDPGMYYFSRAVSLGYNTLFGSDDNTEDEVAMHGRAMDTREHWDGHIVTVDNWLEDASTVASIDARTAMTDAWENGQDVHEMQGEAVSAIYDYYAQRQRNHIVAAMRSLNQHAHVAEDARRADDTDEHFINPGLPDHSDGQEVEHWELTDDRGQGDDELGDMDPDDVEPNTEFELVNGETFETVCPEFFFEFDGGDEFRGPIDDEWVDGYEEADGTDSITLETADGHEIEHHFQIGLMTVPDADLKSRRVMHVADDFMRVLQRIEEEADLVSDNYDLDLAEALFDALDDGRVTPEMIRSPEGYARHLSGTDDVHSSRYKMALLSTLGLENPDLSETAHMVVSYDGPTSLTAYHEDDSEDIHDYIEGRSLVPTDYQSETVSGMLYGRPDSGISTGGTYLADPYVAVSGRSEGYIAPLYGGPDDATMRFEDDDLNLAGLSTFSQYLFLSDYGDNNAYYAIDLETGEQVGSYGTSDFQSREFGEDFIYDDDHYVILGEPVDDDYRFHTVPDLDEVNEISGSHENEPHYNSHSGLAIACFRSTIDALTVPDATEEWSFDVTDPYDDYGDEEPTVRDAASHGDKVYAVAHLTHSDADGGLGVTTLDAATGDILDTTIVEDYPHSDDLSSGYTVVSDDGRYLCHYDNRDGIETARCLDITNDFGIVWEMELPFRIQAAHGYFWTSDGHDLSMYSNNLRVDPATGDVMELDHSDDYISISTPGDVGQIDGIVESAMLATDAGDSLQFTNAIVEVEEMQDSDGEDITILTDSTIEDIESQSDRDIEEIVDDIDELDSVDDVTGLDDLRLIAEHEEDVSLDETDTNEQEYSEPDYDSQDIDEMIAYLEDVEDWQDSVAEDDDDGINIGLPDVDSDFWSRLASSAALLVAGIVVVVLALVALVSRLHPANWT